MVTMYSRDMNTQTPADSFANSIANEGIARAASLASWINEQTANAVKDGDLTDAELIDLRDAIVGIADEMGSSRTVPSMDAAAFIAAIRRGNPIWGTEEDEADNLGSLSQAIANEFGL